MSLFLSVQIQGREVYLKNTSVETLFTLNLLLIDFDSAKSAQFYAVDNFVFGRLDIDYIAFFNMSGNIKPVLSTNW